MIDGHLAGKPNVLSVDCERGQMMRSWGWKDVRVSALSWICGASLLVLGKSVME